MEERLRIILLAAAVRLALAPFFMHAADLGTLYESSAMVLRGENVYDYVYGEDAGTAEARPACPCSSRDTLTTRCLFTSLSRSIGSSH